MTMNNSQVPQSTYQSANLELPYPVGRPIRLRAAWLSRTLNGHTASVTSVALSDSGHLALSGSWDDTIKLWDLAEGRCLRTRKVDVDQITSVALSASGRWALAAFAHKMPTIFFGQHIGPYHSTLFVWDLANDDGLQTPYVNHLNWAQFVASVDGTLSGSNIQFIIQLYHNSIAMTLDASYRWALLGSYDGPLKLWDLALGRCLRTLYGHTDEVTSIAVKGSRALSGSYDGPLKLWDLTDGRCVRTLSGHTDSVRSVALSSCGRWALSGSSDQTVKVWDLAEGRCVRTLEGHTSGVTSVAFGASSRWALSGSDDGTVKVWALDWELETFDPADWDEGARPYLVNFLTRHTPFVGQLPQDRRATKEDVRLALTRRGKPTWSEEAFQGLIRQLSFAGYGWLRPEGVCRQLAQMAQTWTEPPALFGADHANAQQKPLTSENPLTVRETLYPDVTWGWG